MIVTGAPVEHLPFEEVEYWNELTSIIDFAARNVTSTIYICWAAQAALYHHYRVPKRPLGRKLFGVFSHHVNASHRTLFRGFDDLFYAPHSRSTTTLSEDLLGVPEVKVLAESDRAGVYIAATDDDRSIYVTGHAEYDPLTLQEEYFRDLSRGIAPPENYFPDDDPTRPPVVRWRSHAHLFFSNWLNYSVYQTTPYLLRAGVPSA